MKELRNICCMGLFFLLVLTFLCPSAIVQAAEKKEIIIGAPIPITGNIAMNGGEEKWAFEQAIKDANAKGGIFIKQYNKKLPIKFIVEDAESDPGKAVAATERLVKIDKVDLLLSSCTGNLVVPVAMAAEKMKVYYHASSCFPFLWRPGNYKWSTLYFFELPQGADVPFDVLTSLPPAERPKKLALLMEDSADGRAFDGGLREAAKKYKYEVALSEFLGVGAKDYSAQILKLKSQGIDSGVLLCADTDAITFVRQSKEADFNIKYLHGNKGTVSNEFYSALGKDADYVLADGLWSPEWPYPKAKEIGDRYQKEFHRDSQAIGLYYALAQTLLMAIEKAGTADGAKVRQTVMTTPFKGTVMGDIKYKPDGVAVFINGAFQWWEGKLKTVFPFELSGGWKLKLAPPWKERK